MKLKFKTQPHQTAAVQAVVDCFKGQVPQHGGVRYRLDPGVPGGRIGGIPGSIRELPPNAPDSLSHQECQAY
jgi:hypothetical protein